MRSIMTRTSKLQTVTHKKLLGGGIAKFYELDQDVLSGEKPTAVTGKEGSKDKRKPARQMLYG